jgi:ribose 5-phosphate isomerase B
MKLAIGSDEKTSVTDAVVEILRAQGHELKLFGPLEEQEIQWPEVARLVAESVSNGDSEEGILFCWTGTGVSIAANKVPGIRAALCADRETARGARIWNNANVLCLSLRRVSQAVTEEILESWFETPYQPNPEDDACLQQVLEIEKRYAK